MSEKALSASGPEMDARREKARARRAIVRTQITKASDALAAADLLLGLNFSISAVGRPERE